MIIKNNQIKDAHNNENHYGEVGSYIYAIYHHLPDNKIVEHMLKSSYDYEDHNYLEYVYKNILKIRSYYELDSELPKKQDKTKIKKLKL